MSDISLIFIDLMMVNEISVNGMEGIHARELLLGLNNLRQKWDLCDVELRVGKTHIPAHRAVLSACSDYFASMFTRDLIESRKSVIDMKDVDEGALRMLVDFVYTGKVNVTPSNVQTVLPAADLLQLSGVKEACEVFLAEQLHPSNALGIAKFADTYSCFELHRRAKEYVDEHFASVATSEEFLEQSSPEICNLVQSDNLNVVSEKVVFDAVVSWVNYDVSVRSHYFSEILSHVRLLLLPIRLLRQCVENNHLISQNTSCRQLFKEALDLWTDKKRCSNKAVSAFRPRCPPKFLVAVGGKCGFFATLNSAEKFDPVEKKWSCIAAMNLRRYEFGIEVLEGNRNNHS